MSTATRTTRSIQMANDQGRAALIIYFPAGFPDLALSRACIEAAVEGGADLVEVGFPYSDPLMDGPTIQRANAVALDGGFTPDAGVDLLADLSEVLEVPLLVMTYLNIAWHYGAPDSLDGFARALAEAGADGAILPDLPASADDQWRSATTREGLSRVYLCAPSSTDERIAAVVDASTGFIYATSTMGVTGMRQSLSERAAPLVQRVQAQTPDVPVCVGIGVTTPQHAAEVGGFADGVIVGSAVVRAAEDGGPRAVRKLVSELRDAVG